jgi:hypothetical protein
LTRRALTLAERDLAQSVFGDAINYDKVSILNRKWWPFQSPGVTMAPRGNIHFHPKGNLFCDDFCDAHLLDQGVFIHEMTHVWQHQKGIILPLARHPFCQYSYSIKPGWRLERYGIEQQAEIVRHYFLLKQGYPLVGAPPIEIYQGMLPFGAE